MTLAVVVVKKVGQGGRKLFYTAKVQFSSTMMTVRLTAMLGLQPGDNLEVKLGRKQIRLIPGGGSDEEE